MLRRWILPTTALVALAASLAWVVQRGEEGRRLTSELEALEEEAIVTADRILAEHARIDSLTTMSRIADAAAPLGLRQAVDAELVQVDADAEGASREVGGER